MTDPKRSDAAAVDPKDAARKIEDAGVADESAAYTDAMDTDETADTPAKESAAHPS